MIIRVVESGKDDVTVVCNESIKDNDDLISFLVQIVFLTADKESKTPQDLLKRISAINLALNNMFIGKIEAIDDETATQ